MTAARTGIIFVGGALSGLLAGYLAFGESRSASSSSTPAPHARSVARVVDDHPDVAPVKTSSARGVTTAIVSTDAGRMDSVNSESQRIAALEEELKSLKATMSFDRDRQAEQKGNLPVEAPAGLAPRFMDEGALREMWRAVLSKAGLPSDDLKIDCREYPCFIQVKNLGPDQLVKALPDSLPSPYQDDRRAMRTSGRILPDGGMLWTAVVALIPKEEPEYRSEAIATRIYTRARASLDGGVP